MYYDVNDKLKGVQEPPAVPLWTKMSKNNNNNLKAPLSQEEEEIINNFQKVLDKKFAEIVRGNYSSMDMFNMLYPILSSPNIVSKIVADSPYFGDKRHVNIKLMVAMRRVFGISIDEMIDENFKSLGPRC